MSTTWGARTIAPRTVDDAVAAVRARGLKASAARRLVLAALFAADAPVTAERIASGLGGRLPASDIGSVYRNLETLERLGVVRPLHAAHGPGVYAIASDEVEGYVACERCGEVRAADARAMSLIRTAVERAFGYEASFVHFPIVGVCARCRQ
jgi:Fur family ferric uptake transcriptional regulator